MFYCFQQWTSNGRDLNPADIELFPAPRLPISVLDLLSRKVETDYEAKAKTIVMNNKKTGRVELESLSPSRSKTVLDEIDEALKLAYGLNDADLDIVINCDVKYRVGLGAAANAEEDVVDD